MPRKRTVTLKTRLRIMKRDNFKCVNCGNSPATDPRVYLEVDHHVPFSKDGPETDENLVTLCFDCNRGKGNDEELNKSVESDFLNWLDQINPDILQVSGRERFVSIVANSEEFAHIVRLNRYLGDYEIQPNFTNTIVGYGAGGGLGIYTLNDSGGSKVQFVLIARDG